MLIPDTPDRIDDQLLEIFRRKVKKKYRDNVNAGARLQADLNMDSLGVLSAMLAAEEELGLKIFPLQPDVSAIRTVGDIIRIIKDIHSRRPLV